MAWTLAELRQRHEPPLTQRALAAKLGVAHGTVANWELGLRTPSLAMAKRVAQLFGVPVEAIKFGADESGAQSAQEAS